VHPKDVNALAIAAKKLVDVRRLKQRDLLRNMWKAAALHGASTVSDVKNV